MSDALLKEFKRFDLGKTGELEENQAMMLLESRKETKTALELRETFSAIDIDKNHKLSFLEWCCYVYQKDYQETNNFVDAEAREAAMAEALAAGAAAREIEEAAARAKAEEEEAARRRAEEIEAESKLVIIVKHFQIIFDLSFVSHVTLGRLGWLVCLPSSRDKLRTPLTQQ